MHQINTPDNWPDKLKESFRKKNIKFWHERGENYVYADNFRIARVDNVEEVKAYEESPSAGCCGFFDQEIELEGTKVKFEFNYGH